MNDALIADWRARHLSIYDGYCEDCHERRPCGVSEIMDNYEAALTASQAQLAAAEARSAGLERVATAARAFMQGRWYHYDELRAALAALAAVDDTTGAQDG